MSNGSNMKEREVTILSIAIIVAAFILGAFFFKARSTDETIQVVGSAVRRFDSDIVKWQLQLSRQTDSGTVSAGYAAMRSDLESVIEAIRSQGIEESEIMIQPMTTQTIVNRDGDLSGYRIRQSLFVFSDRMGDVEQLALNPDQYLAPGVFVNQSRLEYFYSRVDELKRELLGDAAADARKRAEAIAGSTDVSVGKLMSANAGVFQITEPFSTEVSSSGVYDTSSRQKDIKVTVHADFQLK